MKKYLIAGFLVCALCLLAACTPRVEDLKQTYKENDFEIQSVEIAELGIGENEEIFYAFKAVKSDESEATVVSFSNGNAASKYYNEQYAQKGTDNGVLKIGNTVITGSKEAVEIVKNK